MKKYTKYLNLKNFLIAVFVLLTVLYISGKDIIPGKSGGNLSTEELKSKIGAYFVSQNIEDYQVMDITEYNNGLYAVNLMVNGQAFESYITADGAKLFGAAIPLDQVAEATAGGQEQAQPTNVEKNDKPSVELFVMSHCPYGTQIEKGILPVVKTLGDKIDFNLKFVNYAMHGETEIVEQTNQYCINKNEPEKLLGYLECFLEDGDSERCQQDQDINTSQLNSCFNETDNEFSIMANLNDQSSWLNGNYPMFNIHQDENEQYGVRGSPTLVINGTQVSAGRDSASLLATVCGAFNESPEECNTELSSDSPSPGFGYNVVEGATDAQCN